MSQAGFLSAPEHTPGAQTLFDDDTTNYGFVMNASRLWAYQPATHDGLFELMRQALSEHRLTIRERGILVAACASTLTDSYCSLAWGSKLAGESDADTAAAVLRGTDDGLTAAEKAMATWARLVVRDPNRTTVADVRALRDAGFDDGQIFSITTFVALRLAFSTVNDALGAQPDAVFRTSAPNPVLDAVTYGRPIEPASV